MRLWQFTFCDMAAPIAMLIVAAPDRDAAIDLAERATGAPIDLAPDGPARVILFGAGQTADAATGILRVMSRA